GSVRGASSASRKKKAQYFAAVHVGLIAATCWCLMLNGFVGFQFREDGTRESLWFFGATSAAVLMVAWSVAAATLNEWPGFSRSFPWLLWIVHFFFNGTAITVYLAAQVVDRLMDGLFFATIGNLLSVYVFREPAGVYKCWDDITKDDLEFAAGSTYYHVWDVVGPMQAEFLEENDDDFVFAELSSTAASFRSGRADE
ncbi:MAG: chitin synthase III catalytic subunit-domain-containing protein, partial [Olpidium bornovanus]